MDDQEIVENPRNLPAAKSWVADMVKERKEKIQKNKEDIHAFFRGYDYTHSSMHSIEIVFKDLHPNQIIQIHWSSRKIWWGIFLGAQSGWYKSDLFSTMPEFMEKFADFLADQYCK
jgi:hypothetical protein